MKSREKQERIQALKAQEDLAEAGLPMPLNRILRTRDTRRRGATLDKGMNGSMDQSNHPNIPPSTHPL